MERHPGESRPYLDIFYDEPRLENLAALGPAPEITGDCWIDERIWRIAAEHGYKRQCLPLDVSRLVAVESEQEPYRLQPLAARAYELMRIVARLSGAEMSLSTAYRDHDGQRELFLEKIDEPYTSQDIIKLLKVISIPGYSKHHTGYTIDIREGAYDFESFAASASYNWLTENNYDNALQFGWMPSYPPGIAGQDPDPRAWEFTYIGEINVTMARLQWPNDRQHPGQTKDLTPALNY